MKFMFCFGFCAIYAEYPFLRKKMKTRVLIPGLFWVFFCAAYAESWSNTNVQYLYGNNFDRLAGADSVPNGSMETITLEHSGGWEYGKNFLFVDLSSADFGSGKKYKLYAEWAPKISLAKISDSDISWGLIKDVYIAGEINQGDDFRALNLGLALAVDIPAFNFFDLNLFTRKDNFNERTMQLTLAWNSTFELFSLPLVFEGFFDYYGTDFGTEIISQPRLLLDGKVFSDKTRNLQLGTELYYYRSSATSQRGSINEAVPQVMLKWIW